MTELSFSRQFLQALDSRPLKLSGDHIADPRNYPAQSPYILPRHQSSPQKKRKRTADDAAAATGTPAGITVHLKSMKPAHPSVTLAAQPLATTSVFELKTQYAAQTSIPVTAIKLLYAKKPVPDSKTVREVLGPDAEGEAEFTVMVVGGATATSASSADRVATPPISTPEAPVAQGPSGKEVLKTEEFWSDLNGFLLQRIRDEAESKKLVRLWRDAYKKDGS